MPKRPKPKSKWQQFKDKWEDGCGNHICSLATHVCLARGKIPSDVVFVGEAPGLGEDIVGSPFIGAAGSMLDSILAQVVPPEVRCSFTNIVGCIPRGDSGKAFEKPEKIDIKGCSERLKEYLNLCDPKLVIGVGDLADKWIPRENADWEYAYMIHPGAIIRMHIAAQPLEIKKCVVTIADALSGVGLL